VQKYGESVTQELVTKVNEFVGTVGNSHQKELNWKALLQRDREMLQLVEQSEFNDPPQNSELKVEL